MEEYVTNPQALVPLTIGIVVGGILLLVRTGFKRLNTKIAAPLRKIYEELLSEKVEQAITSVYQSYVKELRLKGIWDNKEIDYKEMARLKCFEAVKSLLGKDYLKGMTKFFGGDEDFDSTIRTWIESLLPKVEKYLGGKK